MFCIYTDSNDERVLDISDLFDCSGNLIQNFVCFKEKYTGLYRPISGSRAKLPNGTIINLPSNQYIINPNNGLLLTVIKKKTLNFFIIYLARFFLLS